MRKFVDFSREDKPKVLLGSVMTHRCSPTEDCYKCGGSGRCQDCAGRGYVDCVTCSGSGKCQKCGGRGVVACSWCHGTGIHCNDTCYNCKGKGYVRCWSCNGGNGLCSSCNGSGHKRCYSCSGSGSCNNCNGSGQVICSRCSGTGLYQTYQKYVAHYTIRQFCHSGTNPELIEGLRIANGYELSNLIAKSWSKENTIRTDNTDESFNRIIVSSGKYGKYAEEFRKEYARIPEMNYTIQGYSPYMNILRSSKIPCTRVKFIINDKEYKLVFVGNNGVVCYGDLPESVKAFDISENERIVLKNTRYERHKALAILTAYMYNLQKDEYKIHLLEAILMHMCLDKRERWFAINYLLQRYSCKIDINLILDKVSCLFVSKKTISYVWQCVTLNKQPNPVELDLFSKVVNRYRISESEVNNLKKFASNFAKVDDSQIIREYLDTSPVYRDYKYEFWKICRKLLIVITIITAISLIFVGFENELPIDIIIFSLIGIGCIYYFSKENKPTALAIEKIYNSLDNNYSPKVYRRYSFGDMIVDKAIKMFLSIAAKIGKLVDILRISKIGCKM